MQTAAAALLLPPRPVPLTASPQGSKREGQKKKSAGGSDKQAAAGQLVS